MNQENMEMTKENGLTELPTLLVDTSRPQIYDFNEPDAQFTMFDRELEGCVLFRFSKAMKMQTGKVTVNGREVPCKLRKLIFGGKPEWWFGMKPGSVLHDYDQKAEVIVSGFVDEEGNEMHPLSFEMQTVSKNQPQACYEAHDKVALQAAQDGIVLLKNDENTLPLKDVKILNLFGKGMYEFKLCAVGAGKIRARYYTGLLEAARNEEDIQVNEELTAFYSCGEDRIPDEAMLHRAKEQSDTAVMVLSRFAGENSDNSTDPGEFYLTREEETLIETLGVCFSRVIVLLNVGYPISTAFAEKYHVDALVYCGFGGMMAGTAIMDVLTGRMNPSGKLPDTWSERYESIPAAANFYNCANGKDRILAEDPRWLNTVYEEDIYVGYRYFETFETADKKGYPFGFGLSYTTFSIDCKEVSEGEGGITVQAKVCNTGDRSGREVVQLYVSKPQGELEQPARELIGFEKTALLAPGEHQLLTIFVPYTRLRSYDEKLAAYVMVSGRYDLYLGNCVRTAGKIGSMERASMQILKQVKNRMMPNMPIHCLSQKDAETTWPQGASSGVAAGVKGIAPDRPQIESYRHELLPKTGRRLTFRDVQKDETLLEEFVGNLTVEELVRISVCAKDGWGMDGRGEAGRLYLVEGLDLPEFVVSDGNSGVNLYEPNIGFPSGTTMCASFDKELMEQVGTVIAEEAREHGIHLIMGPGMNLHRNPLNGRQPEYFSEDPYLAGVTAGRFCKGLEKNGVGGCYKHFIANNAESGRKRNQSVITERAIRELYFGAFEYAIEEQMPSSIMTAYNAVNGIFTSCDPELLEGLLYEELGFTGFIMTDWTSYDTADIVEMAKAGNAWITPGSEDDRYTSQLVAAVEENRLSVGQLQKNVFRMLRVLLTLFSAEAS